MLPPWHFLYLLSLLSYLFLCILLNIISFFLVNLVKSIVGKHHWILSAFRNGDQLWWYIASWFYKWSEILLSWEGWNRSTKLCLGWPEGEFYRQHCTQIPALHSLDERSVLISLSYRSCRIPKVDNGNDGLNSVAINHDFILLALLIWVAIFMNDPWVKEIR